MGSLKKAIEILQQYDLREAAMEGVCNRIERLEKIMRGCRNDIQPWIRTGKALGGDASVGSVLGILIDLDWALQEKCPICKGEGVLVLNTSSAQCAKCHGSGKYPDSFQ